MAKHLDHGGKWIRKEKRWAIYTRDGFCCVYCMRDLEHGQDGGELTLDHLDENGGNHESNLITCCPTCNKAKAGRTVAEFASDEAKKRIKAAIRKPIDKEKAREDLRQRNTGEIRVNGADWPVVLANPAQMAALAKTTTARLAELGRAGRIPEVTPEGYDVIRTLAAIAGAKKDDLSEETARDRARQTKAEADKAEMRNLIESKEIEKISREIFDDAFSKIMSAISGARYLEARHKKELLKDLRAIDFRQDTE